ncbi:hypothetical protein VE00_03260 [Pseudogymnoascus sp. WSF 3629]|nr:hypothetical protein VE00_03260 [Pseudogymnoascus sp. WSF 3629]
MRQLPPPAALEDLSRFSPHDSPSSSNYGMGSEPAPLLSNQGDELTGAISITNGGKEAVSSLEPHSAALSATALHDSLDKVPDGSRQVMQHNCSTSQDTDHSEYMGKKWINLSQLVTDRVAARPELYTKISEIATRLLKLERLHSGTAALNGLWASNSQRNENQDVGFFCIQEGDNKPITSGDKVSIHYVVFKPSDFGPHFSTYDKQPLNGLAQPQPGFSALWLFSAVLGQKLGGQFLYRKDSGIHSVWYLVEVIEVNGISYPEASRRSGMDWLPEKTGAYVQAQEQGGEAAAGEPSTSMDVDALMRAIQDKSLISPTLGSSSGNRTTVGTSTPNEALPNERDTHSMRSSSSADGESKIGSEDGGGSVGGAGADAGANTGASTEKGNRERRFKCGIEGPAPNLAAQPSFLLKL